MVKAAMQSPDLQEHDSCPARNKFRSPVCDMLAAHAAPNHHNHHGLKQSCYCRCDVAMSLVAGRLLKHPPSASSARGSVSAGSISQLGAAHFAKKYPAVLAALLKSILELTCDYHRTLAGYAQDLTRGCFS